MSVRGGTPFRIAGGLVRRGARQARFLQAGHSMQPEEDGGFDFSQLAQRARDGPRRSTRRRQSSKSPLLASILLLVVAAGVAFFFWRTQLASRAPILLRPIDDQQIDELTVLRIQISGDVAKARRGQVRYSLRDAPPGAAIDPRTGVFTWQPTEAQGPGWYEMTVRAELEGRNSPPGATPLRIFVGEVDQPPSIEPIGDVSCAAGETLVVKVHAHDADLPAQRLGFRLPEGAPPGAVIDPRSGELRFETGKASPGEAYRIAVQVGEVGAGGLRGETSFTVRIVQPEAPPSPRPAEKAVSQTGPAPIMPQPEKPPSPTADDDKPAAEKPGTAPDEHGRQIALELFDKHRLLHPAEYKTLRKIFAERFAGRHEAEIRAAFGEDAESLGGWLDEHADIKEEFYTAIDPEHDNVAGALGLFRTIWKEFPQKIVPYANLAIAVAVTWDDQDAIYDYAGHQRRTKSVMPSELAGAIDNFRYLVQAEQFMQGRGRFLPWEFLVHVVDHRTPLAERQWALKNYLPRRAMIGKCYGDVPYDTQMLATGSEVCRMAGEQYTLANLRTYGGVCAMQADFASRVGKSLGVPAVFVGGESRYGEHHAWVMWVELTSVSKTGIGFSLPSHGRYRGDHYYVGHLRDPRSGQPITDRQLELRLHAVGMNPLAKRQSDHVMKLYPLLCRARSLDVTARLGFLNRVIQLCPGNEQAWRTVAAMSREGKITKAQSKMMMGILDGLFRTFAAFPDFTWEIFDDLIAFQDLPQHRQRLYARLIALYEQAHRPDLSCSARLRYTEYLLEDDRRAEAIQGLAASILAFPDEGRFVPAMLDKLEQICDQTKDAQEQLLAFYQRFLPLVPRTRGKKPSAYCVQMYQRASERFRQNGQEQAAAALDRELSRLQALDEQNP